METLRNIWQKEYTVVPEQLKKVQKINAAATGFNANIDAVLKIKGKTLQKLILDNNLSSQVSEAINLNCMQKPTDVILGIVKCFVRGIAEEWITDKNAVNKKGTRLLPMSAKFRRATIDRVKEIFAFIKQNIEKDNK